MHREVLETAHQIATQFLDSVASRHVGGATTRAALLDALDGPLPRTESDPVEVLKALAANADPGIVASAGPRYFGFVTGGAVPVTVAADCLPAHGIRTHAFTYSHPPLPRSRTSSPAGSSSYSNSLAMPASVS